MSTSPKNIKIVDLDEVGRSATVQVEDNVFLAFVIATQDGARFAVAGPGGHVHRDCMSYDEAVGYLLESGFGRCDAEGAVLLAQAAAQDEV